MSQAPVGRDGEWDQLSRQLAVRRSGLIVLSGPAGSGRTHLVRRFGALAAQQGYSSVGVDEPLSLEPTTRLNDVRRTLSALLGTAEQDASGPLDGHVKAQASRVRRLISAVSERFDDDGSMLTLLSEHAPLLVAVDGYEPSPMLGLWVTTRLVPYLRTTSQPVLLVVVDRPERVEPLRDLAVLWLELGGLDVGAVSEHLRSSTLDMVNPLEPAELTAYAAAAAKDPSLLRALDGVLAMLPRERGGHVAS